MGFIDFTNGEVLTADQMDLVMRQGIMRFADAAARDTALSEVLAEGMMAYLDDTDEVLKYDGTSWIDISGDITGVTAGTALTGGGTSGNVTLDVDTSVVQPNVITTQGDIVIGDASGDPVRLPVGSADQVLTSDGTTVSFQDAGGGGGIEEYTLITSGSLSNEALSITSIPQTYDDLLFRFDFDGNIDLRFNGVDNDLYRYYQIRANGSPLSSTGASRILAQISQGNALFQNYAGNSLNFEYITVELKGRSDSQSTILLGSNFTDIGTLTSFGGLELRTGTFELYGVTYV